MNHLFHARRIACAVTLVAAVAAICSLVANAGFGVGSEVAPLPLISSAPVRPTISSRATLAFDQASGLTYECSFNRRGLQACLSPVTRGGIEPGRHTFRVRSRTAGGTLGDTSTYSWRVVRSRRRLVRALARPLLTTVPVWPWISRNATLAWLQNRSATSECRLDTGRWKQCASPKTYRGLRLGRHAFRVRAKRENGRRSSLNRFIWTIALDAPPAAPTFNSVPDANTTSTDAVFKFNVAARSTFECRIDVSGWQQCSNPAVYVGLGTGPHTFCVRTISPNAVPRPSSCIEWFIHSPASPGGPSGAFTISGNLPGLLSPGVGSPLPLTVSNPFDFDLRITSVVVAVRPGTSQPGCDGHTNLQVTQSNTASGTTSFVVPAHESVTLPDQGASAPQVAMLNLATNQDTCKNTTFTFSYSGTGTGL